MLPSEFQDELVRAFTAACQRIDLVAPTDTPIIEKPRAEMHGDFYCPIALALAKQKKMPPRQLADDIVAALEKPPWVNDVQVVGPGFINVFVRDTAKVLIVSEIITNGEAFGGCAARGESILVEFVSANPTGPLHVGHGRACAYGDSLANILTCRGYDVRREYYVNDAGRQMNILMASVWLRYWRQHNSDKTPMPTGAYRGDYLIPVADALADELQKNSTPPPDTLNNEMQAATDSDAAADILVGAALLAMPRLKPGGVDEFSRLQKQVRDTMLDTVIKEDMRALQVDVKNINFFYETTLYECDKPDKLSSVDAALKQLQDKGDLYEQDGALWFKSTAYGDDKDRVVRRSNGDLTYFAADIAYHANKLGRERPTENKYRLINVLGADHHGYIPRLNAVIHALGHSADDMETHIIQLVALVKDGIRLKMSTRAGTFIPLQEVVAEITGDVARYFYISRKNDQHLDFDLTIAKARKNENPAFYIQYAYARICSVLEKWGGDKKTLAHSPLEHLAEDKAALRLCQKLSIYPDIIERAAAERAPHQLATYMHELAGVLHTYYEATRILPPDGNYDNDPTSARLALLLGTQTVFNNGMALLKVTLSESM